MSEPLKPCPFCGGEATIVDTKTEYDTDSFWVVECISCNAKSDTRMYDEQSIEAWNTRANDKYNELVEFIKTRVATQHIHAITDLCMANDAERLLRKHGVEI